MIGSIDRPGYEAWSSEKMWDGWWEDDPSFLIAVLVSGFAQIIFVQYPDTRVTRNVTRDKETAETLSSPICDVMAWIDKVSIK